MASDRQIEAPGIELREIDRSQEQKPDYSLPNSPNCLTFGPASRGEDYTVQWVNSKATRDELFGTPTNELETWFYNSITEILDRGGTALAAKIPYDNGSLERYTWRQWSLDECVTPITISSFGGGPIEVVKDIKVELQSVLSALKRSDSIDSISSMWSTVADIAITEFDATLKEVFEPIDPEDPDAGQIAIQTLTFPELHDAPTYQSTISGLAYSLSTIIKNLGVNPYAILKLNDSEITSYVQIVEDGSGVDTLDNLDRYLTYSKALVRNKIRVYDVSKTQYGVYDTKNCVSSLVKDESKESRIWTNDCLGVVPVLVTAPNAMYFQNLLESFDGKLSSVDASYTVPAVKKFNLLSSFGTLESGKVKLSESEIVDLSDVVSSDFTSIVSGSMTIPLSASSVEDESTSRDAALVFPPINWKDQDHYEKDYLKHIGIAVFKAFKDLANDSRISFELVEAFVGSLDRSAQDKMTHASTFIDNVVNSRSRYIRLFSNAEKRSLEQTSTLVTRNNRATSLGFHQVQCKKRLSLKTSVMDGLTRILDQCRDPNTMPLDLVIDGGVSNIAQLIDSAGTGDGAIDLDLYPRVADFGTKFAEIACRCGCEMADDVRNKAWSLDTHEDTKAWRQVLKKLDDFCKYTRRDCMLLADGLRTFCLEGDEKLVRRTKPTSSIRDTLIPKLKYMANALNSSYAAGWCNWFLMPDAHTGDLFWCPPSIKAASICIYCDTYFHPWEAPAGMTRGIVPNVVDVAFNPTNDEAGKIYNHQWNYAISYPIDGIIMEGQKTFQTAKTALDRINVRRLMLDIEKDVIQIARRFLYEGNTAWLRQRFVDAVTPVLEDAVTGDGITEYAVKCDEELNTAEVIENHELRCKIGVKPVKTLEYLILDFSIHRQDANVAEEVMRG